MGRTCEGTKSKHEHCRRGEIIAAVLSFAGRLELGVSSRYTPSWTSSSILCLHLMYSIQRLVLAEQDRAG